MRPCARARLTQNSGESPILPQPDQFDRLGHATDPGGPGFRASADDNVPSPCASVPMMSGIVSGIPISMSEPDVASEVAPVAHAWVLRVMSSEGPAILRMLWRLLGREADVLDAYQDCFCKLATVGGARRLRNAKAYAYRTAGNVAIEMLRKRKRHKEHQPRVFAATRSASDDAASGGQPPIAEPVALSDAIARLPEHLRNVITLRDLGRMSYDEVGRTLSITPATARVYRRHAIVKLADFLHPPDDSP